MALITNLQRLKERCHLWNSTIEDIREQLGEKDFEFTDLIPVVGLYQTLYLCKSEPSYQAIWGKYASWCVQQMVSIPSKEASWLVQRFKEDPGKAGSFLDFLAFWSIRSKLNPNSKTWKEDLVSVFQKYEEKFKSTLEGENFK